MLVFNPLHQHSATPRAKRGKRDEQQKTPIPPAVEHITRHNNESVLQPQLPLRLADEAVENEPIEQKDYRQKQGELYGVEEHILCALRRQRYDKFLGYANRKSHYLLYISSIICHPTLNPK